MGNFVTDVFSDFNDLSTPWRFWEGSPRATIDAWKDKVNNSQVGSPIHGLKAGFDASKWTSLNTGGDDSISPLYNMLHNTRKLTSGEQSFGDQFRGYQGTANQAYESNKPAITAYMIGSSALGNGAFGAADDIGYGTSDIFSGAGGGALAKLGMGMASNSQQSSTPAYGAPPTSQPPVSFQDKFQEDQKAKRRQRLAQLLMSRAR